MVFRRIVLLALLLVLVAVGSVRADEAAKMREAARWRIYNPCFDDTGKWYRR